MKKHREQFTVLFFTEILRVCRRLLIASGIVPLTRNRSRSSFLLCAGEDEVHRPFAVGIHQTYLSRSIRQRFNDCRHAIDFD